MAAGRKLEVACLVLLYVAALLLTQARGRWILHEDLQTAELGMVGLELFREPSRQQRARQLMVLV